MMTDQTVIEYRNGDTGKFQQIVEHHIPIIRKVIRRYSSQCNPYEDILEVGLYELVVAVKQSQKALVDNNITPYIIRWVVQHVLDYLKMDRLIVHHLKPSWCERDRLMTRQPLIDIAGYDNMPPLDRLIFWEMIDLAISSDLQHEIVMLRLQRYTNKEILNRLPQCKNVMAIHRHWTKFVDAVLCGP